MENNIVGDSEVVVGGFCRYGNRFVVIDGMLLLMPLAMLLSMPVVMPVVFPLALDLVP